MEDLRMALQRYTSAAPVTMGAGEDNRSANINRENLERELAKISTRNEKYFIVGVVMAVVLFIALIVTTFVPQGGSTIAQAVPPLLGSSAAVVVWRMFHNWNEKNYTDCILALIPNVDDDMLRTIVAVLVQKI